MKLNHTNLVVKDVDKAISLFTEQLGFNLLVNRNSRMAVLENADKFVLVIWGQVLNQETTIPNYPRNFHIGFYQENEDAVHAIYQKLEGMKDLKFDSKPDKMRDTFGFYFYFESIMIEISVSPFKKQR